MNLGNRIYLSYFAECLATKHYALALPFRLNLDEQYSRAQISSDCQQEKPGILRGRGWSATLRG